MNEQRQSDDPSGKLRNLQNPFQQSHSTFIGVHMQTQSKVEVEQSFQKKIYSRRNQSRMNNLSKKNHTREDTTVKDEQSFQKHHTHEETIVEAEQSFPKKEKVKQKPQCLRGHMQTHRTVEA